jgi:hypothetical protein
MYTDLLDDYEESTYASRKLTAQLAAAKAKGLIAMPGDKPALPDTTKAGLPRLAIPPTAQVATELLNMKTVWVDVTPEQARAWLKNNVCNRPLRKAVVANYARQMKRGEWLPIAQGIAFDTKQQLLNGQHRLSAIVASGQTVRLLVTFSVPARIKGSEVKPMDLMDTGLPRSISDQLKIQHGLSGGSILAAIVRSILYFALPQRTWKLSVAEVLMVYRLFEPGITFVQQHRPKDHGLRQAGVLAAFALALTAEGSTTGQQAGYFHALTGNEQLPQQRPLGLLASFLRAPDAILLTRRNDRALVPMVLGVIEAETTGQAVADLQQLPEPATLRAALSAQIERLTLYFADPTRPTP